MNLESRLFNSLSSVSKLTPSRVDLPPNSPAKPLPVEKSLLGSTKSSKPKSNGVSKAHKDNDTPKAFARLMNFRDTGHGPNGLDNRDDTNKRRKAGQRKSTTSTRDTNPEFRNKDAAPRTPKIRPGEKLSDFSTRVDQALPVSGLAKKGKKVDGIRDHRITKHEQRLRRMQEAWRKEDKRLREQREEQRELVEEAEAEERDLWEDRIEDVPATKGRKGKRKRILGELLNRKDDADDPWAILQEREKPIALHDVVQAPPVFKVLPKKRFKIKGGARVDVANVPNKAGSLKRREDLGGMRNDIIAKYRQIMSEKRGSA